MGKTVKKIVSFSPIKELFKAPEVKMPGPDAKQIAAATLQSNLSKDLGLENVAQVDVGGAQYSADDNRRKRKAGGGVSGSLGIL